MPTMDAGIGVSYGAMPVAIQKLSKAITDFSSRAPLAALSLHTIAHACQSIFGLRAAQVDVANLIFANASTLNALNVLLCKASEPAVMPRDVEDLKKTIASCCVTLDSIKTAEDRLGIHLSENFFEEGQRPVARYNAFQGHEKDEVLSLFKKCQEQAVRLLMYAQRHRLEKTDNRTDIQESELICLDAAVETFTGPVHDSDAQVNKTAQTLPDTPLNHHRISHLRGAEQQANNDNTWSIVCPNSEDHIDLERTVPSDLLDTPASSRASTPDPELSEKPFKMANDNANVGGSDAPAKKKAQKPPKARETTPAPGLPSAALEPFTHFFKELDLTDGKYLIAYVLQPKTDVANGATTWSYIIERLSLDHEALAEQFNLRNSYDSVIDGLTSLLPVQISRIQEHTKSLDATLISIKLGRELELVSPMGTVRTRAVIFVIRTPATKIAGDHPLHKPAVPSYYFEEPDGANARQRYTTLTFSDRHRVQDRSLEEIRLADYQTARTSSTEPGAKPYPWEPGHRAAAPAATSNNNGQTGLFSNIPKNPFGNPMTSHGCWGVNSSTTQAGGSSSGKVPSLFDPPTRQSNGIFEQPNNASQNQNIGFHHFQTAGTAAQAPTSAFYDNSHARSLFNNGGTGLATHLDNNPHAQGNNTSQAHSGGGLFGPYTHATHPQTQTGGGLFNQPSGGLFNQPTQPPAQHPLFPAPGSGSGNASNAFQQQPGTSSDDVKNVPKGWQPQLTGVVSQPHPFLQTANVPKPHSGPTLFGLGQASNTPQIQNVGGGLFGQPNNAPKTPTGSSYFGQPSNAPKPQTGPGLFAQPNQAASPKPTASLSAKQDATKEVAEKSEKPTTTKPKDNGVSVSGKPVQETPHSRKRKDLAARPSKADDESGDMWKCKTCSENLSAHFRSERDRGTCDLCAGLSNTECWLCAPKFGKVKDESVEKTDKAEGKGKAVTK